MPQFQRVTRPTRVLCYRVHFYRERANLGWLPLPQRRPQHLLLQIGAIIRFLSLQQQHAYDEVGDFLGTKPVARQRLYGKFAEAPEEVGRATAENGTEVAVAQEKRREEALEQATSLLASRLITTQ